MTQKEQLRELLEMSEGQPVYARAKYLYERGVRVMEKEEPPYEYSTCPYMNAAGDGCTILANMICREHGRTLPCGFFPQEKDRRAEIVNATGRNIFRAK